MTNLFIPHPRARGDHNCNQFGSFRGIAAEWGRRGYVNVHGTDSPFCWFNKVGDVLLYDRPTLEWLPETTEYRVGLFGNADPPVNGRDNRPWFFWPRYDLVVEKYASLKPLPYRRRDINCVFIGTSENPRQRGSRWMQYWRPACDWFEYWKLRATWQKYSNTEYCRIIRRAKFGLSVPGYGPKCHREIENMAMGVVPIFTPGCSLSYAVPPIIGTHCFMVGTVDEAIHIVHSTSEDQWTEMSRACQDWYWRNASIDGSYLTTIEIIESDPR